jgi:hypothetical protein
MFIVALFTIAKLWKQIQSICLYLFNTNISNITYTYKYIKNIYPKVELVEETKGGGKERKITNNK